MRTILSIIMTALVLAACSHNLREGFDMSVSKYNDMIRRNELGAAGLFASGSARDKFVERAEALKDVKIIDYRIVNAKYSEEKHKADVEVEFSYYNLYANKVKALRDIQEWTYADENGIKGWWIRSPLPEFK